MIHIAEKQKCCGCEACVQACPKGCIRFETDDEGFGYPVVDRRRCVDCHQCETACPVLSPEDERIPQKVYAAFNKDETTRSRSASGGIFTLVAGKILQESGVVFGVRFNADLDAVYGHTETLAGLDAFRRSKYVQAKVGTAFRDVASFLAAGRKVLFTGTPCQVAALRKFLKTDSDNLVTMDLICEGVPSPKAWRRYLKEEIAIQEAKFKEHPHTRTDVAAINFRDKARGWIQFGLSMALNQVDNDSGKVLDKVCFNDYRPFTVARSPYMVALFKFLDLRPVCYECPFKCGKSGSDLTVGDYWGIHKLHPEFFDNKGTSMVYVHTAKGARYFDKNLTTFMETPYQEAIPFNNVVRPVMKHPNRDRFFAELDRYESFEKLVRRLAFPAWKRMAFGLFQIAAKVLPGVNPAKTERAP